MNILGSMAATAVIQRITAPTGVNACLAELMAPYSTLAAPVTAEQIRAQNVAVEVAERAGRSKYPALNVYCEKIVNSLEEKFRSFSGNVQMVIEVRHSLDRLDGLQSGLELYVDSVMQVLDANRGDWGSGLYYSGGYEVAVGPVKHGGKNFIQSAKITFQIGVSRN